MSFVAESVKNEANQAIMKALKTLENAGAVSAFIVITKVNPDKVREVDDLLFVGGYGLEEDGYFEMVESGRQTMMANSL